MNPLVAGRRLAVPIVTLAVLAALAVAWYAFAPLRVTSPIRIGYRHSPPFYFAEPGQPPRGIAIEVLTVAAARRGLPIEWRLLPPDSKSAEAILRGEIDIWPTFIRRPGQDENLHVTDPWIRSEHFLLMLHGTGVTDPAQFGTRRLAIADLWPDTLLVDRLFPRAQRVFRATPEEKLVAVCRGEVDAAFVEGRQGQTLLFDRPAGCEQAVLDFRTVPGAAWPHGIGSRMDMARLADTLRAEIGRMSEDGSLSKIMAAWAFTTTNETQVVAAIQSAHERTRLVGYISVLLLVALLLSLWQMRRSHVARRLAEAAARTLQAHARTQERYRVLFERNAAGVISATLDGRLVDCNATMARILGYDSPEEVVARSAWDLYRGRADREAMLRRLLATGSIINEELTLVRKDGHPVHVMQNASLVRGTDTEPAVVDATIIDITEQRRLEEQYRQAQKLESIGRLAGGVAHDFNNLLTAITGYTEMLLGDLPPEDRSREALEEIRKAGEQAAALTHQLLAFSRKQLLQPEVLDVNAVIADSLKLIGRVIGEDIQIVTAYDDGLWPVEADRGQLVQVIMNLAVNARDAMPTGGQLRIDTRNVMVDEHDTSVDLAIVAGPCVALAISDTGLGMDPETLNHIFEPFFTTKERGKGTGLGLSTVYGIVTQSGGHIRVESVPGQGTRFEILFPRAEAVGTPGVGTEGTRLEPGCETVLLVEDQDEVRRLAARVLARQGYRVHTAAGGAEALDLCRTQDLPIDLLVSDVVMPGMSGPHLAASLATRYPDLKVLFISGYSENLLNFGIQPGSVEYLQKPFTPTALAQKVREVLAGGATAS